MNTNVTFSILYDDGSKQKGCNSSALVIELCRLRITPWNCWMSVLIADAMNCLFIFIHGLRHAKRCWFEQTDGYVVFAILLMYKSKPRYESVLIFYSCYMPLQKLFSVSHHHYGYHGIGRTRLIRRKSHPRAYVWLLKFLLWGRGRVTQVWKWLLKYKNDCPLFINCRKHIIVTLTFYWRHLV